MTSGSHAAKMIRVVAIRVSADSVPLAGYASKIYETKAVRIDMLDQTYTPVPKIGTRKWVVGFALNPIQKSDATRPRAPNMPGTSRCSIGAMFAMLVQPCRRLVIPSIKLDVNVEAIAPTTAAIKARPAWCSVKPYVIPKTTGTVMNFGDPSQYGLHTSSEC